MAVLMEDIATVNLPDTEMTIAGLNTVPASSSVLPLTARTLGLLALGGLAVWATTSGLVGGLALGVAAAAALANPAVRDILTDQNFWDAMKKGLDDPSKIPDIVNDVLGGAQRFIPRRDSLTIDLNNNGLPRQDHFQSKNRVPILMKCYIGGPDPKYTGADAMAGGAGNETYSVDNAGDVVVETADPLTGSSLTNGLDV